MVVGGFVITAFFSHAIAKLKPILLGKFLNNPKSSRLVFDCMEKISGGKENLITDEEKKAFNSYYDSAYKSARTLLSNYENFLNITIQDVIEVCPFVVASIDNVFHPNTPFMVNEYVERNRLYFENLNMKILIVQFANIHVHIEQSAKIRHYIFWFSILLLFLSSYIIHALTFPLFTGLFDSLVSNGLFIFTLHSLFPKPDLVWPVSFIILFILYFAFLRLRICYVLLNAGKHDYFFLRLDVPTKKGDKLVYHKRLFDKEKINTIILGFCEPFVIKKKYDQSCMLAYVSLLFLFVPGQLILNGIAFFGTPISALNEEIHIIIVLASLLAVLFVAFLLYAPKKIIDEYHHLQKVHKGKINELTEAIKLDFENELLQEYKDNLAKNVDAQFMNSQEAEKVGLRTNKGIPLGDDTENSAPIHYAGEKHLITIAPNGTGKGVCVQIPTLLEHDASILMIDPKGENAVVTARYRRDVMGQKVHILNPFGVLETHFTERGFSSSSRFNPLASLDPQDRNFTANVNALCEALILTEGKDPYFDNSARDLISCLIMHVCTFPDEIKTLPRIRQLLTLGEEAFRFVLRLMADSDFPPLVQKVQNFVKDTKGNDAILSTARTQTGFLDDPCLGENLSGSDFKFADLKRGGVTVFIVLPARHVFTYSRWFRLLVTSAVDEMMGSEEKGRRPVLFMLDEFPILGHLSCIQTAVGMARGFGVQLWPFLQDINQLNRIYEDGAGSFFANAGVQQYFTPNDLETAKHIEKICGEKTNYATSTTYGERMSQTDAERKVPLFSAYDLRGMPLDKQLLFFAEQKNPLYAGRMPYYENGKYRGKYDQNPYVATPKKTKAETIWD